MHLLPVTAISLDEGSEATDLQQPPGDIVVLSFADSDLGALAAAHRLTAGGASLRLASLRRLRHPLSVDLYIEKTAANARFVLVRCLGGLDYWRYGIEHLSQAGVDAMKAAGTVAVLLPGAYYTLRDTQLPPIAALREAGVPMAVSTDHNPGTSPALSLLLMLNMACTLFRLTVPEALDGVTRHAARALGLQGTHGALIVGQSANFVLWDVREAAELAYWFGQRPVRAVVRQGRIAEGEGA